MTVADVPATVVRCAANGLGYYVHATERGEGGGRETLPGGWGWGPGGSEDKAGQNATSMFALIKSFYSVER